MDPAPPPIPVNRAPVLTLWAAVVAERLGYASARLDDEPFSTSPTEGAVQWLLHRRMGARANALVAT